MAERPVTDFPTPGNTRRVSLRTSNYRAFDLRFALDLRKTHPELWQEADALVEEDQFEALIPIQRRGGSVRNEKEEAVVRQREDWAARHAGSKELKDVVAQIRWLVVGKLGIDRMKALVNEAKEPETAESETETEKAV